MEPMNTDIAAHLTTGAVVVYAIEWLKASGLFPWIHADSKTLNRTVSALAAGAVAFGISATGDSVTGWVITVPPLATLMTGAYHWLEQFVLQQLVFDGVVQRSGKGVTT